MSHPHTCHIDHCCDRHAMNTWAGLTLYLRPKLVVSALVAVGAAADGLGFWDMPVPKRLFMQGLVWMIVLEFIARLGRGLVDGWREGRLRGAGSVALYAALEGLILYVAYVLAIGMTSVMVNTADGTDAVAVLEGVQLFFICVIGATQLVMALVHVFGSQDEAKAWVRGLRRNWTWMKKLADEVPEGSDAK